MSRILTSFVTAWTPRACKAATVLAYSDPMNLLMLCVANSARSQMAEAWGRHLLGEHGTVQSAGSAPATVNPYAARVMAEVGLALEGHRSKSVDEIDPASVDTVITWCADEVCPAWLGQAERLHFPLPDPASDDPTLTDEQQLVRFRVARDAIERLLREVLQTPAQDGA